MEPKPKPGYKYVPSNPPTEQDKLIANIQRIKDAPQSPFLTTDDRSISHKNPAFKSAVPKPKYGSPKKGK